MPMVSRRGFSFALVASLTVIISALSFRGDATPRQSQCNWTLNGSGDIYNNNVSGKVGIGIANPERRLHVSETSAETVRGVAFDQYSANAYASVFILRKSRAATAGNHTILQNGDALFNFTGQGSDGAKFVDVARIRMSVDGTPGENDMPGRIEFWTTTDGAAATTERMRIDSNGKVGIGTANPAEKLDVDGNINVSGNINAKYRDIAEWVDAETPLDPGTVVVADQDHKDHVVAASEAYDTRVIGVIATKPGIVLGEAGKDKVRVAAMGRVLVKVDASSGAIRIGDLLVTGTREGYAIKSEAVDIGGFKMHRPGTILGKALEPLDRGTGQILVLLSLH